MVKETIKIFLQTLIGLIIISFIAFVSHKFFNFIVSFSSEDDGIRQAPFIATLFLGFLSLCLFLVVLFLIFFASYHVGKFLWIQLREIFLEKNKKAN